MNVSSKPYYILPGGEPDYDIPRSRVFKDIGGKIVVGKYQVHHRNKPGERFPWVVYESIAVGTDNPADDYFEIETFPQYRDAVRHARKLDRQHLAAQKKTAEETKAA